MFNLIIDFLFKKVGMTIFNIVVILASANEIVNIYEIVDTSKLIKESKILTIFIFVGIVLLILSVANFFMFYNFKRVSNPPPK